MSWFRCLALTGFVLAASAVASADGRFDAVQDLRRQGKWAAAESLATDELFRLELDQAADSLEIAQALFLVADSHYRVGELVGSPVAVNGAERCLRIRERRLGLDHLEAGEVHALLARMLKTTEQRDSGIVHARRALEIRRAQLAPTDTLLAESHEDLAGYQYEMRDFQGARESFQSAISIFEQVPGTERRMAIDLDILGVVWIRLGDRERGKAEVRRAIEMLESRFGPDEPELSEPLGTLANIELNAGNPIPAIELYRRSLRIIDAAYGPGGLESLTTRYNMSLCYQQLGDWETARRMCQEMLPEHVKFFGPDHPRTLTIRQGRAFANKNLGLEAEALAEFREVAAIYERNPAVLNPNLPLAWREIAVISRNLGRLEEAKAACEHAIQLEKGSSSPMGAGLLSLHFTYISILERTGDVAAIDSAAAAVPGIVERYRLTSMLDRANVAYWMARADRAAGRSDVAWALGLESERFSRERMRLNLESAPDRRALQFARRQRTYLDLVLDLAGTDPQRAETAWDRLVRIRGQVAAEMTRRRPPVELRSDSTLVRAHERWIEAQRRYTGRLVQAAPRDSAGRALMDRLRSAAEIAEHEYAQQLTAHGTKLAVSEPGLSEVRAHLAPTAALIGFIEPHAGADTARVMAFIVRRDGPVLALALGPSSTLDSTLAPWRQALSALPGAEAGEATHRKLGAVVRALTWDRLAPLLPGVDEVFFVPDGPLANLPWPALPDGPDGYLLESGPLFHELNAERELIRESHPSTIGNLLVVGDPDYTRGSAPPAALAAAGSATIAGWLRAAEPCLAGSFGPLPGTGEEARNLAGMWEESGGEALVLLGAEATEARFKQEAPNRAILHIATHGYVLRDSCDQSSPGTRGVGGVGPIGGATDEKPGAIATPAVPPPPLGETQRVWLAFTGANHARDHEGDENEGLLTAEEVITLNLESTEWAVLSACHSSLAEGWYREGVRGMCEAFLFAGARSIIASRWAIEDDATRDWMTALYAARIQGETDAARAIALASRQVLSDRRNSGRSTHPFYWAAFSASGR